MEKDVGQNCILNTQMIKYNGLFQILNAARDFKFYNIYVFKLAAIIEISFFIVSLFMFVISIYFSSNNANELVSYIIMFVVFFGLTLNHIYIIKNSDAIWDCMRVMYTDFISNHTPRKETFKLERLKYEIATTFTLMSYLFINLSWLLTPIFQRDNCLTVNFNNLKYEYSCTPFNILMPVPEEFQNILYYYIIYVFDTLSIIFGCHVSLLFDFIVITMCTSIECQLHSIANSYSACIFMQDKPVKNKLEIIQDEDTISSFNFKTLVQDNQKVIKNLVKFLKIFRPLILFQTLTCSSIILLVCILITMNYINGMSLMSPENLKMASVFSTQTLHLFIFCNLFTSMNDQKASMNFSLYCSNWTQTNIKFKKLILLIMRMNASEKTVLKISMRRKINMEIFASVMHMVYSITSVLARKYESTRKGL